jgi:hypothetical protein
MTLQELHLLTKTQLKQLHKEKIIQCLECSQSISIKGLSNHLKHNHNYKYDNNAKVYYDKFLKEEKDDVCIVCNNNTKFISITKGYQQCCSIKCSNANTLKKEQITNTKKEKYGQQFEGIVTKVKQTKLERYGNENYNNINKIQKTNIKKYGSYSACKSLVVKDKIKQTHNNRTQEEKQQSTLLTKQTKLEKYGNENYNNIEQHKQTMLDKYGNINYRNHKKMYSTKKKKYNNEHFNNKLKIKQTQLIKNFNIWKNTWDLNIIQPIFNEQDFIGLYSYYKFKCITCGYEFEHYRYSNKEVLCPKCNHTKGSSYELQISDFIQQYIQIETNKRFYYNKQKCHELDIYITNKQFGIELNGLFYHSEKDKTNKLNKLYLTGIKPNYHLIKTNFFKEQGIQLLHIWDNEWLNKQNIVKSIILSKLNLLSNKVFARKCVVQNVSSKESNKFLENNHLQGKDTSSIRLGLYYDDELVALMTLGKSRYNKNYEYELYRFACKTYTSIIGGFSKLLKYFIQTYQPNSIITYSDKRYSIGNVYKKNGFTFLHDSSPNYFYTKDYSLLESRVKYQKHKLSKILEVYDNALTEWENMQLNGYDRVWDCGNSVWSWIKNN